jgi:hypothetical protein
MSTGPAVLYGYLPEDFAPGWPPDVLAHAQTAAWFTVTLGRGAQPVTLRIADGALADPAAPGGRALAAGDAAEALWTLVDAGKGTRLTAYRLTPASGEGAPCVVLTAALPLTPGQAYDLSLPVPQGAAGPGAGGLAAGIRVLTEAGKRPVEDIAVGERVWTEADGFRSVLWHGVESVPARGLLAPLRLPRGTLGLSDDLVLAAGHHLRLSGAAGPVLVPAVAAEMAGLARREFGAMVTYHQLLLSGHAVILANGLGCESLFAPARLADGRPDDWPEDAPRPSARCHPVLPPAEGAALMV